MTNKCKCKCRKDDVVVLINKGQGGGTYDDFLIALDPNIKAKFEWCSYLVDESRHNWPEGLKSKLQQLCKKKGKKPIVVSALFVADLEMILAQLQQYMAKIYSSSSADEFKRAFGNIETLPIDGVGVMRSNEYYVNTGAEFDNFFVNSCRQVFNHNSVFSSLASSSFPMERMINPMEINSGTFLGSANDLASTDFCDRIAITIDNLDLSPALSDASLGDFALQFDNKVPIQRIGDQNYAVLGCPEGTKYLKLYSNDGLSADDNLKVLTSMGGMVRFFGDCPTNAKCYAVNYAQSAAMAVNVTAGFFRD
jgi:hypothetical protein